jgi:hypothetical protein
MPSTAAQIQETALNAVSAVAVCAEEDFGAYYDQLVPGIINIIGKRLRRLCTAQECV